MPIMQAFYVVNLVSTQMIMIINVWWYSLSECLPYVGIAGNEPGIAVDMGQAWSGILKGMGRRLGRL